MNCKCGIELNDETWLNSRKKRNCKICKYCIRKDNNNRYLDNKEKYSFSYKEKRLLIKQEVFNYYGSICICGETDIRKLSLDHIDGNGRGHRKSILGIDSGSAFYKWVLKHKPNNLRVLCYNCNCQHNIKINTELKLAAYNKYGFCSCGCKEYKYLTIDHINNDGAEHRRKIKENIYIWLKRNNYPEGFQVLCYNCNYLKYFNICK